MESFRLQKETAPSGLGAPIEAGTVKRGRWVYRRAKSLLWLTMSLAFFI